MLPPWCMALPSRLTRTASLVAGQPSGPTLGAFKHVLHVCRQLTSHSPRHLPRARRTAPHRLVVVQWDPCALCGHRALAAVDSQAAARHVAWVCCARAAQVRVLLAKHWPEIQPEKGQLHQPVHKSAKGASDTCACITVCSGLRFARIELPVYTPPTLLPTHLPTTTFIFKFRPGMTIGQALLATGIDENSPRRVGFLAKNDLRTSSLTISPIGICHNRIVGVREN